MRSLSTLGAGALIAWTLAAPTAAQCPIEPPLVNETGAGTAACPCFVAGEEVGAVFQAPAAHYPIEILRLRVGWGSLLGGNPLQLEESLNIYPNGLPNPGAPQFTLLGPQLTDGVINEFDISPVPGNKIINSGAFTVTMSFLNDSTFFGPAPVHDNNGCINNRNVVFASGGGGWTDSCTLGVSGNWVFQVVYRRQSCPSLTADTNALSLSVGGTQTFSMAGGAANANKIYWMLGSATGTAPGTLFLNDIGNPSDDVLLPLNYDPYMQLMLTQPFLNPPFGSFLSVLGGDGTGTASLIIPPASDPTLAGITLHHAYLTATNLGDAEFASNAVSVLLLP